MWSGTTISKLEWGTCHCEERSDEAISTVGERNGLRLLRFARNDILTIFVMTER